MSCYTLTVMASAEQTRLLLTLGPDELLRAVLPPPDRIGHASACPTLLRGLARWLDRPLHVVLSADDDRRSSCLGLTDALGVARESIYYRVQVAERPRQRRKGRRLRGVGDFRQLYLLRAAALRGGAS